jgi:predicted HicB family RNase H-like nuclease
MKNMLKYKGYVGSVEISEDEELLFGRVLGISDLISYEGVTCGELVADFHSAVDDYLSVCEAEGITPEVPYKGSFNVRVTPSLHEQLALYAMGLGRSLNSCVQEALEQYMAEVAS